jgi:hypothetical protein
MSRSSTNRRRTWAGSTISPLWSFLEVMRRHIYPFLEQNDIIQLISVQRVMRVPCVYDILDRAGGCTLETLQRYAPDRYSDIRKHVPVILITLETVEAMHDTECRTVSCINLQPHLNHRMQTRIYATRIVRSHRMESVPLQSSGPGRTRFGECHATPRYFEVPYWPWSPTFQGPPAALVTACTVKLEQAHLL